MIGDFMTKEYLKIFAVFTSDGRVIPKSFLYKDGNIYRRDKVLHVARKASLKTGGSGICYTIMIDGQEKYLFRDEDKWYMEVNNV